MAFYDLVRKSIPYALGGVASLDIILGFLTGTSVYDLSSNYSFSRSDPSIWLDVSLFCLALTCVYSSKLDMERKRNSTLSSKVENQYAELRTQDRRIVGLESSLESAQQSLSDSAMLGIVKRPKGPVS